MVQYDKTINKLARKKASVNTIERIKEQSMTGTALRLQNKRNQDTKNFMEYKVSQIVRSHDRQRSSTLQVHLKEFSKLSRDFERVKLGSKQAVRQIPSPNKNTIRNMKSAYNSVAKTKQPME